MNNRESFCSLTYEEFLVRHKDKIHEVLGGCWIWTAAADKDGYPLVWSGHANILCRVHRLLYTKKFNVELKTYQDIHHECRIRQCVNPDHMIVLTQLEHKKSLPVEFESEIIRLYTQKKMTIKEVSIELGLTYKVVLNSLIRNKVERHHKGPRSKKELRSAS